MTQSQLNQLGKTYRKGLIQPLFPAIDEVAG